ncbi:unnamed protein product [Moneuplotes crassus]|uniref:Uncharacterized protein n=1 Tax=Euplotes crassus TaxID=5936 RepID=A0AAD1X771_EUPCR|nr:unnamed protein product [Moneuplotes crassus]
MSNTARAISLKRTIGGRRDRKNFMQSTAFKKQVSSFNNTARNFNPLDSGERNFKPAKHSQRTLINSKQRKRSKFINPRKSQRHQPNRSLINPNKPSDHNRKSKQITKNNISAHSIFDKKSKSPQKNTLNIFPNVKRKIMETLLNPEIPKKVPVAPSNPELKNIPHFVKVSFLNKVKSIRDNIDAEKNIPSKSLQKFLQSKTKSRFGNFQEAVNGFQRHCKRASMRTFEQMFKNRSNRNSLHGGMDDVECDSQNSKIGIKRLVTLKHHNLSRSQAGSSLEENSRITEDNESIDDTQSTVLSELSLRKQIQHHEQKDTMKYIRELQNRMSKRELQERNKELLSVLNKTTDLYSNKFSISKIRKRVSKQREEKKSQVQSIDHLSPGRKLQILSESNLELYSLNGFLNGYNKKLSLNTDPSRAARNSKSIHLDSIEYQKAKDVAMKSHKEAYQVYEKIKLSKRSKLRKINAKVEDCLTAQDILRKSFVSISV